MVSDQWSVVERIAPFNPLFTISPSRNLAILRRRACPTCPTGLPGPAARVPLFKFLRNALKRILAETGVTRHRFIKTRIGDLERLISHNGISAIISPAQYRCTAACRDPEKIRIFDFLDTAGRIIRFSGFSGHIIHIDRHGKAMRYRSSGDVFTCFLILVRQERTVRKILPDNREILLRFIPVVISAIIRTCDAELIFP